MHWTTPDEVVTVLGLDSDPSDTKALKKELRKITGSCLTIGHKRGASKL